MLLVGLTLWLNNLVQAPTARADGSLRHDPDLIVENFSARKLGESGAVREFCELVLRAQGQLAALSAV